MIKNYILIAWRNFARQKGYSLLNISGLSVGLACCIVILLFVSRELSYDSFHEKATGYSAPTSSLRTIVIGHGLAG
ncbi:MAG: ABC transporter permease [Cyclobacteriaceae bacterium]|nr:ABC transporter permease [Cyclobacteriaceae bacterium]